jgi:DNA-binding response OmpR family regulator
MSAPSTTGEPYRGQASLVLAINDNPDFLNLLRAIFRDEEVKLVTAESGPAALEILSKSKPDVIISDVVMPGIDGIELCRRLKSDTATSDIPILLMSAMRCDEADVIEGLRAGADDYIPSYVPIELLRKKIEHLIVYGKHVGMCRPSLHSRQQ